MTLIFTLFVQTKCNKITDILIMFSKMPLYCRSDNSFHPSRYRHLTKILVQFCKAYSNAYHL